MSDSVDAMMILCTCPSDEVATKLARGLVRERLAACVNLVPEVRSIYRWKDAIEEANEVQLLVKTISTRVDDVTAYLSREHPYEVPEIIALPMARVEPKYLRWMREQTS